MYRNKINSIFLHIGFSKCASTWLQAYFKKIDKIYYKEKIRFFSPLDNKANQYNRGIEYYKSEFSDADSNQVKLESDEHIILPDFHPVLKIRATKLNSIDEVISRINSSISNPKIILVIRNQYELLISRYSQYILDGGKLKFHSFVGEMINCSKDNNNYYENYYTIVIKKLTHKFGDNNVLVIPQELLKTEKVKIIAELNNFLGVHNTTIQKDSLFNQRKGLSLAGLNILRKLNNIFVIEKQTLLFSTKARIPDFIYNKIFISALRLLDYFLLSKFSKSKSILIDVDLKQKLEKNFSNDNKDLSLLLNKNLKDIGYT